VLNNSTTKATWMQRIPS